MCLCATYTSRGTYCPSMFMSISASSTVNDSIVFSFFRNNHNIVFSLHSIPITR